MNMYDVIERIVDTDRFLEVHRDFAPNIIVGFARVDGVVVGIIANQPSVKAGTLDIDASDKGARFIRFCNAFNIPDSDAGRRARLPARRGPGTRRHHPPRCEDAVRLFGGDGAQDHGHHAQGLRRFVSGHVQPRPEGRHGLRLADGRDRRDGCRRSGQRAVPQRTCRGGRQGRRNAQQFINEYRDRFASPYMAASHGMITDVISPAQTRGVVSLALRNTLTKSETRPPKKHGLIPL